MGFKIDFQLDTSGIYKDLIDNPNNAIIDQNYLLNHSVWTEVRISDGINVDSFKANLFGFMSGLKGGLIQTSKGQSNLAVFTFYGYYHINISYEADFFILKNVVSGFQFKIPKDIIEKNVKNFFDKVFFRIEQEAPFITGIDIYNYEKSSMLKNWSL